MVTRVLSQPAAMSRFDWIMAIFMVVLCLGASLDNWAHFHGRVDESFFTPWHAVLYGMMALFGVVLGSVAVSNVTKGYAWRRSLPPGYMLSLVGVGLFVIAGFADLGWHLVYGIEFDTAAYVSPTHLLLLGSALLAGTGPLRSAWLTLRPSTTVGWHALGPMLLSAASTVAALAMFTQFTSPIVNTFAARTASAAQSADAMTPQSETSPTSSPHVLDLRGVEQAFGVAQVVVQVVLLMSMVLLLLHTWRLPFGALTLLVVLPSTVQAIMVDTYWLALAVLVTGLVSDIVVRLFRTPLAGKRLYLIACLVPTLYMISYFAAMWLTVGIGWPATLIAGCVVYAGATGLFLAFLIDWPIRYSAMLVRSATGSDESS